MVGDVRVLVVRAAGINCDEETVHAWRLAGARVDLVHINRLAREPGMLEDFQIVTIPGGFSYGDDIAAGVILAQRIVRDLLGPMRDLVERGGSLLGICNGFQVLVKAGLLPGGDVGTQAVTVTFNDSAKFEARWVRMEVCTDRCIYLKSGGSVELPVEHAEGKVIVADKSILERLHQGGHVAVRYVDQRGGYDTYPANPNGSIDGVAGLCDATGRVFGLMPHPDRHFQHTHHPQWTHRAPKGLPDGLAIFSNAVEHYRA